MAYCIDMDEFETVDGIPFQIRYEAARMVLEQANNVTRRPPAFANLPSGWRELDSGDSPIREFLNEDAGLRVEIFLNAHLGQEDYLTFEVCRLDGQEPSYALMRKVRQAFLGLGRVALLMEPFAEDGPIRVMYSSLTGERLPRFTVTLEGAPT